MSVVSTEQSILEVARMLLQTARQPIVCLDKVTAVERELNCDNLISLVASGFPGDLSIERAATVSPQLFNTATVDNQLSINYVMNWFISIFGSLHDGVLIVDENEIVRYINKSFERISGATFSTTVGRVLSTARPGAKLGGVVRSGKALLGVRRKFGDIEYITDMHPIMLNGRCIGGVTIARDITEIRQLQTKLSRSQARCKDLLRQMNKENAAIYCFSDIYGNSPALKAAKRLGEKLAASDLPILLRGENGTGKELFAHAIHLASTRHDQPFVIVNCAAIPSQLLESELFGYEGGAFSGAKQGGKVGLVTLANNGTLFLDEIGDLDISLQAKMLRVLQAGEVQPVGCVNKIKVNLRLIAATNRNLEDMITNGKFREDLFYRLNVSQVNVPPLRERQQDIAYLANLFLKRFEHPSLGELQLSEDTLTILEKHSWPGNVRELENTVRFIANITDQKVITPEYLPQVFSQSHVGSSDSGDIRSTEVLPALVSLKTIKSVSEKEAISNALDRFGRSVAGKKNAAAHLGISLTTLYSRMNLYNISR